MWKADSQELRLDTGFLLNTELIDFKSLLFVLRAERICTYSSNSYPLNKHILNALDQCPSGETFNMQLKTLLF